MRTSGAIAIALTVLISTIPSAPAFSAATAKEAMSATFGESFGKTGTPTASRTAFVISATASACCAISVPRPLAWGQDRFSSTAWTPYSSILRAHLAYSWASFPYTEPMTAAPPSRACRTSRSNSTIPGFGSPTALRRPASSSTTVGVEEPRGEHRGVPQAEARDLHGEVDHRGAGTGPGDKGFGSEAIAHVKNLDRDAVRVLHVGHAVPAVVRRSEDRRVACGGEGGDGRVGLVPAGGGGGGRPRRPPPAP